MGSSAGHWTRVHIVHNDCELSKVIFMKLNWNLEFLEFTQIL